MNWMWSKGNGKCVRLSHLFRSTREEVMRSAVREYWTVWMMEWKIQSSPRTFWINNGRLRNTCSQKIGFDRTWTIKVWVVVGNSLPVFKIFSLIIGIVKILKKWPDLLCQVLTATKWKDKQPPILPQWLDNTVRFFHDGEAIWYTFCSFRISLAFLH